jgi:hypothetical protein
MVLKELGKSPTKPNKTGVVGRMCPAYIRLNVKARNERTPSLDSAVGMDGQASIELPEQGVAPDTTLTPDRIDR